MIGVIGALRREVELIVSRMNEKKQERIGKIDFFCGKINKKDVVVSLCGVGKVNAAVATTLMIEKYKVSSIINVGIAGALSAKLGRGDILVATAFVQYDFDLTPFGEPLGKLEEFDTPYLPCSPELVSKLVKCNDIKQGIIATGDTFVASDEKREFLSRTFGAVACDMEGGAIAQVCLRFGVSFGAMRVISDSADNGATNDYENFCEYAAKVECITFLELLSELS